MRFLLPLGLILFLSACASGKKQAYDSVSSYPEQRNPSSLSPLISPFASEGTRFEFIANQMKKVVGDYEKMKNQLSQINIKLDQALNKLALYELKNLFPSGSSVDSTPLEDQITLYLKNDEELLIKITKQEDYRQLIGQIIVGDFDIDKEEEERLLTLLKNKVKSPDQDFLGEEPEVLEQEPVRDQEGTKKIDVLLSPTKLQNTTSPHVFSLESTKIALSQRLQKFFPPGLVSL